VLITRAFNPQQNFLWQIAGVVMLEHRDFDFGEMNDGYTVNWSACLMLLCFLSQSWLTDLKHGGEESWTVKWCSIPNG
jgi:hypothetical protein